MRKPTTPDSRPADQRAPSPSGAAAGAGPDAQALLQQLPWGVVVLDAQNTVLRLNDQGAAWWGVLPPAVQGQPLGQAPAGTLPPDLHLALRQVTSSPDPLPGEFFLPQHQQWLAMTSARQGDDWVVYWQDITAQKQLEGHNQARQAASAALLRRTEAVAHTGSYELELATGHFHFSDGLYRLFGEEPGAFVPSLDLIDARSHPADAAAVQQVLAQALADHRPYYYQRRIYRPDGQLRTLECHGRVECDALAQPVRLLGLLQDVTEREQAAQALLQAQDELTQRATDNYLALYNSMDEGFCIVEVLFDAEEHPVDYRFLDVNPAFEKHTGLRAAQGQTIRELVPAIEPTWADVYGQVAHTGTPMRFEADVESMGRWFDINAFLIGPLPNRHVGVLFTDITARKRTEETLRQSEEQFRLLVTATADTVYRMSADWTQREQLIGKALPADAQPPTGTWVEASVPDDDQPLVQAAIAAAIGSKALFELEHRVRRADGTLGWTYSRAIPTLSAGGEVTGWLGAASDVSARKQAEADLHASEQRQRLLIENLPGAAVFVVDRDLRYQLAAGEALRPAGQVPADFRGRTVRELVPPAHWPAFQDLYRQALAGQAFEHEHEQGGRTFVSRGVPLPDPAGQINAVLAVSYDISTRKAAEEALRKSEAKYRTLFDSIDEGFATIEVLFDAAGQANDYRILELNPAYEKITGMPPTVVGRRVRELVPDVEEDMLRRYGEVVRTGQAVRYEQHVAGLGRWFDVYSTRVGGAGSHTVASVFNDITARKQQAQHQTFLLRFSDALRAETGAASVAHQALDMLCEQLQLDRCYIGIYDLAEDRGIFPHQVGNHRIPPLPAEVRLSDFPDALRVAHDQTLRIDDLAHAAGLSDTDRQNLGGLGLRALVAATLRSVGAGPQWAIIALSADVRHWTPGEVALLEEATERTWAAMERARADEALRESEQRFRAVANLVPDLLWRSTSDSDTTWYNQRWYEYTGQTPAEAAGYGWTDAIHPDDRAASSHRYHTTIASGQPLLHEHRIRSAQGEYRWFQVQARPLRNEHGTATAWYGAATDIHARKLAEEDLRHTEERHRAELEQQVAARTGELRESRHLLQTVFDASPTAIVVMRSLRDEAGQAEDFEILIFNEFNKRVVGRDDLVGQRFTAMFPNTVPTGILARLLAVVTTGKPADFEQWYEGEGMRHWFRHIAVRQNDLLVLTSEVITDRKLLEQGQTRSLALLQQSEAVATMGSWEYDLRTHEFTWSDGLYRLLERPLGSAIGLQVFLDAVLDDDRPAAVRLLRTLTTGAAAFDTTLRLRLGDAVKTVRFKAVPLPSGPPPPERVLGVCLDVSDVERLEAENLALKLDRHKEMLLAILQAQETERQRLGEVLHNGLGQVLYATKLHLDQLDVPGLHALPALSGLYRQTGRLLAEAMRQTRTLAHELVPTSLLEFGLPAAVRDVCRDLSTPRLRIACHVWGEELPLPQPVQVTLFRLVQELVHNIVRHAGATQATLELETLPGWLSLRAEDNGHGFDPQAVAEGLGLRTLRQAVALLGGTVAVDSSPEFGTHIRLRIPLPLFS